MYAFYETTKLSEWARPSDRCSSLDSLRSTCHVAEKAGNMHWVIAEGSRIIRASSSKARAAWRKQMLTGGLA